MDDLMAYEEGRLEPEKVGHVKKCLDTSLRTARDLFLLRDIKKGLSSTQTKGRAKR